MVKSDIKLYRFDKFQIDAVKRVLLRENTPVQLPSRAFDVLLALVEHSHYVIDKDELMSLVWGERVVEENNLTRHISTLRKALDEAPNDHRYIVTVPGRGYSFVAQVERVPTSRGQSASVKQNGNGSALNSEADVLAEWSALEPVARLDPFERTKATITIAAIRLGHTVNRRRWLWATVLIVFLASIGLFAFKLFNTRSRSAVLNSYREWDIVRLTRTGGSAVPDISRDGKYVAYVNIESEGASIWIQQLATSTQQQLVPPEMFSYSALLFSPGGSELYFSRAEGSTPLWSLYRIPVVGGVAKKLRDGIEGQIVLSPDGAHLAFARRNSQGKRDFVIADLDGVEERVLVNHSLDFPAWAPDANVIAFSVGNASGGGEEMSIHEIRLSDGAEREISSRKWQHVSHKSWLPDGSGLIVCARDNTSVKRLWFVAYPSGEARPLSNNLDNFQHPKLTADARTLVAQQSASVSDIWSGPLADMGDAKKIGVWGGNGLCLVTDGRIVYSSLESGEAQKIWIMNADGTERKQLTTGSGSDISTVASPDGRLIVFASNRTGNSEIWRMNTDGSNLVQLTNSKGANPPSISPDGRWVIYLTPDDGKLHKVPIAGGEAVEIVTGAVGVSAVSPDGKLIAYFAKGKQAWAIAVNSFEDGSVVKRFEVGSHSLNNTTLKWTPDGKALLYSKQTDSVGNIWMQPLDGGPAKQVTDFKADGIFRFDLSADGKNLVCARGGWKHDLVLIKNLR